MSRGAVFLFMNENVYPDPQEITDFLQLIKRDLGKLYCSLVSKYVRSIRKIEKELLHLCLVLAFLTHRIYTRTVSILLGSGSEWQKTRRNF